MRYLRKAKKGAVMNYNGLLHVEDGSIFAEFLHGVGFITLAHSSNYLQVYFADYFAFLFTGKTGVRYQSINS